jgi:putative phosphonate metabolism protein
MRAPRYAIYYTPPPGSPLAQFGNSVLGYDCAGATDLPHLQLDGVDPAALAEATAEPRRYGFHATLKAPFYLNDRNEADLVAALDALAAGHAPVTLGRLAVAVIGRFIALVPAEPNAPLMEFAGRCVDAFDPYRAPLTAADRERRIASGLSARQIELLDRWGYPYVLEQFRFHMTLTGPLVPDRSKIFAPLLAQAFAPLAGDEVCIDAVSLLRQDDPASRFHVVARRALTGRVG